MADLNKPVPRGLIPYGFHVNTKNGKALVINCVKPGLAAFHMFNVLYGIADNRRYEDWIRFSDITAWQDKGIADGAYFQEYREVI